MSQGHEVFDDFNYMKTEKNYATLVTNVECINRD